MVRQARTAGIPPRELFEKNPLPMWVYDQETMAFLAVNAAAVRHYGYSRRQFLAMTIKEIRPLEEIPALLDKVSPPAEGPDEAGNWKHRKKDGTIIDVEITTHTLRFAGRKAKLVLARDVTERKRREQLFNTAAREWRTTFDAMSEAIAWIDRDGKILRCNKALAILTKKNFPDIIGHPCEEVVSGTAVPAEAWPSSEVLTTHKRATATLTSGSRLYKVSADPLFNESGEFIGAIHMMSDITQLGRAERVLAQTTLQQEAILDNIPDLAWLKDEQGRFLAVNQPFARACGAAPADLVGKTDLDVWPRHLAERYRADDAEVMRTRARKVVEEPLADKEGITVLIETIKTPIVDDAGRVIGTTGIARDITTRKRNEAALKASEGKFRTLFDTANDAIFIVDFQGNFIDANTVAHERLGFTREELLSKNVSEIDTPEFAAGVPERIAQIRKDGKAVFETAHIRKDGTVIPAEINASVIEYEGREALYSIVRDISERKRAEKRLRDSRSLYERTLASLDESVVVADLQTRLIVDCNPATERIYGYPREELIGRDTRFLFTSDEQYAAFREKMLAQIAENGHAAFEFLMKRKDGNVFLAEHFLRPVLGNEGKTLGIVSVVRDISARKKAEAALLEQKHFTEQLIQGSSVATFVINNRHEIVFWNKACEELTGVTAAALLGSTETWRPFHEIAQPVLADLVLDQDLERCTKFYPHASQSVLAREGLHAENWAGNLNGKDRYIVFDAVPIRDSAGNISGVIETIGDSTAQKLAEEAIAASEARYHHLFDNASDMIQSVAPDGHFLYVNPKWRKVLGYSEAELAGLTVFDIIHPGSRSSCRDHFAKVMAGEQLDFLEAQFVAKDGRLVAVEGSANVRLVGGTAVSTQGIFRDVTERKKLQEELYRISHDWEETFDTLTDMVTVHDKDFNIIRANKAAEKILGLPLLEARNAKCFEYFHGTACPPAGCPSCASLVTGKFSVNEIFEPHLGRHLEIRAIPRLDSANQVVGLIHVVRDITERKKAEEALEKYSRELAALNTASGTLVLLTDLGDMYQEICNIIVSVLDLRMAWFGTVVENDREVRPVAFAGHEAGYLQAPGFRWDDSPLGLGPTGLAVKTKKPVAMRSTDPALAPWRAGARGRDYRSAMAVPLIDSSQVCIGVLNFYSADPDYFTADRMKLCQIFANQAAIAVENAKLVSGLEETVSARTRAFEDANVELQHLNQELELRRLEAESASRTKSAFLANMSHELRTPLNAVIGFSDLLVRGMAGPLAEKPKEYLGDILASGRHLLSLINDILDLSKVEAGKMEIEPAPYDLTELIERSLVLFREKASQHRLELRAEFEGPSPPMFGDDRKVRQIIYNLLSNAVKFTPDGGSVSVRARTVRESGRDYAEISVCDTGIGIAPEDQQRLFQPFSQLSHHLTKDFEGTGLGLALCKSFVELHGGRIGVESAAGRGSTFTFSVPVRYEKGAT